MATSPDYRSLEREAVAATAVARGSSASRKLLRIGIPVGAVLIAAWMILSSGRHAPTNMTTPDKEDFRTVQFPAPSLEEPRPAIDQGTIVIPQAPATPPEPVPPPPVAPPMALPAPPPPEMQPTAPPPNDDEAKRLAELERQRQEEERRKWERFRAPQVITDHASDQPAAADDAVRSGTSPDDDPNRRFLASVANAGVEIAKATQNHRIDALVAQGTMIHGVLETALQSDLPGMVRAVTAENVWSFDGRRVLIPAGSRLVGEYKSGLSQGQTRVFIVWTRLLRSDGVSVQIGSNGTDELGRAGNAGFVDNHYVERFGSAAVLSLVGGISQYLSAFGQNSNNANGTTITTTDPTTGLITTTQTGNQNQQVLQARQIAAQNVSQTLTNIAQDALKNSINIPPTIHVDQGTRIIVFVRRDLDFSALYPDPVTEALRQLRHERADQRTGGNHDDFPR